MRFPIKQWGKREAHLTNVQLDQLNGNPTRKRGTWWPACVGRFATKSCFRDRLPKPVISLSIIAGVEHSLLHPS